jgi:hypothetical protein
MAPKRKPLRRRELSEQAGFDLPNREALSLLEPGLGIVDVGATTQPTDGAPATSEGGTTPTGGDTTTTGGLESKATRIIGPLPLPPTPAS